LWFALILAFVSGFMLVWAGGDWVGNRLAAEKGMYERVIGKELRRLFLGISPQEFVIYHAAFFVGIILLIGVVSNWFFGIFFGGLFGLFGPRIYLKSKWGARLDLLNEQVEEAMVYMANSFKANPSLPEAMQDVCNAMGPPISQEFGVLLKEYHLGTPLDQALINLQRRVPARNLELAIAALVIGRTVGGNIPEILSEIANTIRESYRLERLIDTQTSQGKMQAWVMGMMPAVVLTAFYFLDRELIEPLFGSLIGYTVLGVAAILNIIGVALILKIVAIDV
jgi:tight adherence protein B